MFLFNRKKKSSKNYASHLPEWWKDYMKETEKINFNQRAESFEFKVLDLETTGLDVDEDRIISVGLIPILNYEMFPGKAYHTLVYQDHFKKDSVSIHGLTMDDLKSGITEESFLETIIPELAGTVIVGHHIGFDIAMINKSLNRHWGCKLVNPVLDTAMMYKRCFPIKFVYDKYINQVPTLDEIASEFELAFHDRHSAMGDAAITGVIFMKLLRKLQHLKVQTLKELLEK